MDSFPILPWEAVSFPTVWKENVSKRKGHSMKIKLLSATVALFILLSCSHETHLKMHELNIDFQGAFENDHVRLVMGGGEVLNRNLETNNLLGVCTDGGQLSLAQPEGEKTITITINHNISKTETFILNRTRYIGINYDRQTHEITFQYSDEPFGYD
jgi:hypothetical protein